MQKGYGAVIFPNAYECRSRHDGRHYHGGGVGTRFWPLSRAQRPEQFLKIFGTQSLPEETLTKIAPLADQKHIYTIVQETHRARTAELLQKRKVYVLTEPLGRNTAPCIGLGLIQMIEEHGDSSVVVLAAARRKGCGKLSGDDS